MKKIIPILILFVAVLSGCKKEKSSSSITPKDAKAAIEQSFSSLQSCAQAAKQGKFLSFVSDAINEDQNQDIDVDWVDDLLVQFEEQYIEGEFYEGNRVNEERYNGVYTWDKLKSEFVKATNQNKFEIRMPSKPDNQDNLNLIVSVDNFNEIPAKIDGEEYYVPSSFHVMFSLNGSVIFSFALNELTIDPSGNTTLPIRADISVSSPPYSHNLVLSRSSARQYFLAYNTEAGGACTYGVNLTANSNTDTYEEFDIEEHLETVSGNIQISQVSYEFSVNVKALVSEEDITAADINREASVNVVAVGGEKLAELQAVDRNDGIEVDLVYSDNSRVNFFEYIEQEFEKLEGTFDDF